MRSSTLRSSWQTVDGSSRGRLCSRKGRGSESEPKQRQPAQLAAPPILVPTVVKVVLAFWPSVVMAARQTTMMRANMTAYSTAVGPSSRSQKSTTAFLMRDNITNTSSVGKSASAIAARPNRHRAKHLPERKGRLSFGACQRTEQEFISVNPDYSPQRAQRPQRNDQKGVKEKVNETGCHDDRMPFPFFNFFSVPGVVLFSALSAFSALNNLG